MRKGSDFKSWLEFTFFGANKSKNFNVRHIYAYSEQNDLDIFQIQNI